MKDLEKFNNIRTFYKILLISILLVSSKWIISYLFFDESIDLRIINDVNDSSYFPLIKSFSELNFNPSYSENLYELKLISFPIFSLFINSIFFKLFGSYSFIILEYICVFLFILIFYFIFTKLNFSKNSSITYSLFLFILPTILSDLAFLDNKMLNITSLNFNTFYNLRFPRPIITNLFLYSFIFFLTKFYLSKENNFKIVLLSIIIMSITLHVFFYMFIFQFFLLLLIYLDKFKSNIFSFVIINYKMHILFIFMIILSYITFHFQMQLSEPDHAERMGVLKIEFKQKIILINYLINFFTKIEFLFLFSINTFLFFFLKKNPIKIFYYLFLSTIISTILFVLIYNKGVDYYHFFNWILTSGLLYIIVSSFYYIENYLLNKITSKRQLFLNISLIIIFLVFLNFSNSLNQIDSYKTKLNDRNELKNLVNFYKKNTNLFTKKSEILSLNNRFSLWIILNDFNNLSIVPSAFWTPKKTATVEDELISVFKELNLNENDFIKFLSNKKKGTRYKNSKVEQFFDRIYLANTLKTFDEKNLYTEEEIKFIKNKSPIITHQLIIPQNEFLRLKNKFINTENIISPDIIVLDNTNKVINKRQMDVNRYCSAFKSKNYQIFVKRNISNNCNDIKS